MATGIEQFYRPVRIMLGDLNAAVRRYPDAVIADGVKTVVQLNRLPGHTLTPGETGIAPDLNPNEFALATYWTVKVFMDPTPDRYSFRTRALSESFGSYARFIEDLEHRIYQLENGEAFSGWQSYFAWLSGMAGLPLSTVLTDMAVDSPLWRATLTREGVRAVPSQV